MLQRTRITDMLMSTEQATISIPRTDTPISARLTQPATAALSKGRIVHRSDSVPKRGRMDSRVGGVGSPAYWIGAEHRSSPGVAPHRPHRAPTHRRSADLADSPRSGWV